MADRVDLRFLCLGCKRLVLVRRAGKCPLSFSFAGRRDRYCGGCSSFFCLLVGRIAFADPRSCHFRVAVIPCICCFSPIMAQRINIVQRLLLGCETFVFELGGISRFAPDRTGRIFGDCICYVRRFILHMGFVIPADPGGCHLCVVLVPYILRLAPVVSQRFDVCLGLCLCGKRRIGKAFTGVGRFAFFRTGCRLGHAAGDVHRFCLHVGFVIPACPGGCQVLVPFAPGVFRIGPVVPNGRNILKCDLLCLKIGIGKRCAGVGSPACGCTGCLDGDRGYCTDGLRFNMCVVPLADTAGCYLRMAFIPGIGSLAPVVSQRRCRFYCFCLYGENFIHKSV